jgi:uncharacterized repeat protein (TIGR01451 family)
VLAHPLHIGKAATQGGGSLYPGDTLVYTILVTNSSGSPINGLTIADAIPAGTSYVSGSASSGGQLQSGSLVWANKTVAAGTTAFTFSVTVNANAGGTTIHNQATLSWSAQPGRPTVSSNTVHSPVSGQRTLYLPLILK